MFNDHGRSCLTSPFWAKSKIHQAYPSIFRIISIYHGNLRGPPQCHPPNNLRRPYFLGRVALGGVPLDSHLYSHRFWHEFLVEAALWLLCLSRALVGLGEGAMLNESSHGFNLGDWVGWVADWKKLIANQSMWIDWKNKNNKHVKGWNTERRWQNIPGRYLISSHALAKFLLPFLLCRFGSSSCWSFPRQGFWQIQIGTSLVQKAKMAPKSRDWWFFSRFFRWYTSAPGAPTKRGTGAVCITAVTRHFARLSAFLRHQHCWGSQQGAMLFFFSWAFRREKSKLFSKRCFICMLNLDCTYIICLFHLDVPEHKEYIRYTRSKYKQSLWNPMDQQGEPAIIIQTSLLKALLQGLCRIHDRPSPYRKE